VANPPGTFVGPGEFEKAFELLKAGKPINYEGASGSVDFDVNGDVTAPIEIWRFHDGKIATYRMEYMERKNDGKGNQENGPSRLACGPGRQYGRFRRI
jgi:hypothetical protein